MQDYVLVLLRNGRRKDEAKKELDVFLGEETATFVSWYEPILYYECIWFCATRNTHSNIYFLAH